MLCPALFDALQEYSASSECSVATKRRSPSWITAFGEIILPWPPERWRRKPDVNITICIIPDLFAKKKETSHPNECTCWISASSHSLTSFPVTYSVAQSLPVVLPATCAQWTIHLTTRESLEAPRGNNAEEHANSTEIAPEVRNKFRSLELGNDGCILCPSVNNHAIHF